MHLLFVVSALYTVYRLIRESFVQNTSTYNVEPKKIYPEPHRNERGQIIIENSQLYYDDIKNYGAYQAHQWMNQGKYNLEGEELKKEEERIKKKYEYLYSLL